ncbi:FadR family transcriptional regulator [Synergistaceae bacterium OttesenSCG-928-I11]|nr:FadR family transcriptional regulator [Synergistaceae bacterium OttesenSCG-928-I11]
MFEKLNSEKKPYNIIKQIMEAIERGEFKENDRLPNEQDLAETFGVSRSVIRESMSVLVSMGVIKRKPGKGTFVQNVETSEVPIASTRTVLWTSLEEIYKVDGSFDAFFARLLIEPVIAEYATYKLEKKDIRKLESLYREMEAAAAADDLVRYHKADLEFHRSMGRIAKNEVLSNILKSILDLIGFEKWDVEKIWDKESKPVSKSLEGHRKVLDLMIQGKEELVRESMEDHLKLSFYENMS